MTTKKTTKAEKPKVETKHPLKLNGKDWDREKTIGHICDQLVTSSKGLGSIINAGYEGHGLPTYTTIMQWLSEDSEISERYARAKEAQADFMADELMEIADSDVEMVVDQNGIARRDSVDVNHKRLRVDTRKWVAAKLKPKKYGDKIDMTATVTHADLTDEELDRRLAEQVLKHKNG